jgi:hypothetical protein
VRNQVKYVLTLPSTFSENDIEVRSDDDDLADSDDDSVDLNDLVAEDEDKPVNLDADVFMESMMKALGM